MGAGDEFIVTGQVREAQERDPRRVRVEYEKPRWHPLWDRNPRIAGPKEQGDFQILRPRHNYLRPYCSSKTPERWTWRAWGPPRGEIYFAAAEKHFADVHKGLVVIEPNIKAGASPNKRWPFDSWRRLVDMIRAAGMIPAQLGPMGTRGITGSKFVETSNIRLAAAVLSRARGAVLTEGALHHIAAGLGIPSVVIYGAFIAPSVTGYDNQTNLFTGEGLGCGWRKPCACCAAAMAKITPDIVMDELKKVLTS